MAFKGKNGEARIISGISGGGWSSPIAPGGTLHDELVISDFVDLSQPDQYTIRLKREDPYANLSVDSNSTTVTVTKSE